MKTITLEENKKSVGHEIAYGYSLDIGNTFILDSIARDIDHALTTYAEAVAKARVEEERDRIIKSLRDGELRDSFEEFFPKDIEATMGIRPSKSNRSGALAFQAEVLRVVKYPAPTDNKNKV